MKSLLLLSGGLDSTTVLALEREKGGIIEALTVDYGQRHRREIRAAQQIAAHYGVPWCPVTLDPFVFDGSALTNDNVVLPRGHAEAPDATYVPARNTVLLALAAARAETIGAQRILIGCNADDAAGYPDCRPKFIEAFRDVLQQGTVGHVWVHAPLLGQTKAQVIRLAEALSVPMHLTWSCYEGLAAGPCGRCGACVAREGA